MGIVLTVDHEWSPDAQVKQLWELADKVGVSLFPFVTHRSEYLNARREPMGVHPNWLPGSTQGQTREAVVEHVRQLVPEATAYRAHCFHDDTRLQWMMKEQGFDYDSNACHFLSDTRPFRTAGGILRFPVFWADDVHARSKLQPIFDGRIFESRNPLVVCIHPKMVLGPKFYRDLFTFAKDRQVRFEEMVKSPALA